MNNQPLQPVRKPPAPNKLSKLLSNEENENVFCALQPKCQSQATAIVEIYGTAGPHHNTWSRLRCGVVLFVKDNNRRSFFIQLFDIQACVKKMTHKEALVFEQEIYREFSYNLSKDFFHQFEGEERMIGLNFADQEEAVLFSRAVIELVAGRQKKREEKKKEAMKVEQKRLMQLQHQKDVENQEQQLLQRRQQQLEAKEQEMSKSSKYKTIRGLKKKYKEMYSSSTNKDKGRKLDIGNPTNFQHISHAGLDKLFNLDSDLVELLQNIGFDNQKMSEPKTREFVYDFIDSVGGLDEVRKMNQKLSTKRYHDSPTRTSSKAAPPPPPLNTLPSMGTRAPPPPTHLGHSHRTGYRPPVPPRDPQSISSTSVSPPSPPPQRNKGHQYSSQQSEASSWFPSTPSDRQLPVKPSSTHGNSQAPLPPLSSYKPSGSSSAQYPPPPLPSGGLSPPLPPVPSGAPPPPPPMPSGGGPPPPPMPSGAPPPPPPPPMATKGSLPPPMATPKGPQSNAASDPRSALLAQIRGGRNLKPVSAEPPKREAAKDSRGEMLEKIRTGVTLNHVDVDDQKESGDSKAPVNLDGWALDLHNALMKREQFIQSDDDSSTDTDDDEWDDDD